MARMKGEEAIHVGDEKIRRGKRANESEDSGRAKKAKVEDSKAAELTIFVGDKTKGGSAGNDDEVNRLCRLLSDDPKILSNKDVADVKRYLEVDEIVSLALKSSQGQGKGSEDGATEEEGEDEPYAHEILDTLRLMVFYIENVEKREFLLLYEKLPHRAFTALLLPALENYKKRLFFRRRHLLEEYLDMIPELCRILPSKLFAHILSYKASLERLSEPEGTSEESVEESVLEKAAEKCEICLGKGKHSGHYGEHCSFKDSVPKGVRVGPNYLIACRDCGRLDIRPYFDKCLSCDSEVGQAVCLRQLMDEVNKKRTVSDDEVDTTSTVSDDTTSAVEERKDGNVVSGADVERLRESLADRPKKLSKKDVANVIRYLKVDEIVTLALESGKGQEKGSNGEDSDEKEPWLTLEDPFVPSPGKVLRLLGTMLRHIEKLEETDFWLLYQNLPKPAFVSLLFVALDSHKRRCCLQQELKPSERDMIPKLCHILPWKLFAHILSHKTCMGHILSNSHKTCSSPNAVQKRAAKSCDICFGEGKHSGLYGYHCSFWDSVPKGVDVGSEYFVVCTECGVINQLFNHNDYFGGGSEAGICLRHSDFCWTCFSEAMESRHFALRWKI